MFLSYYKLHASPFNINSDPTFLWMGEKHKEALATLMYGISENKGFLLLTGDVGSGKTTLINALLNNLDHNVLPAVISDPGLSRIDFFNHIAHLLNFKKQFQSKGDFLIHFSMFLNGVHKTKKKVLLIIDEAQRLPDELLEEVRLLSNIEKQNTKLINIFFVGQNEFNNMLLQESNRALRQRLTLNYHIEALNESETALYIEHRLQVAGGKTMLFTPEAVSEIYKFSGGYPRQINIICDHALLSGYVKEKKEIKQDIIKDCISDLNISLKVIDNSYKTVETADPIEATDPDKAADLVEAANLVEAADPVKAADSVKAADPVEAVDSVEAAAPPPPSHMEQESVDTASDVLPPESIFNGDKPQLPRQRRKGLYFFIILFSCVVMLLSYIYLFHPQKFNQLFSDTQETLIAPFTTSFETATDHEKKQISSIDSSLDPFHNGGTEEVLSHSNSQKEDQEDDFMEKLTEMSQDTLKTTDNAEMTGEEESTLSADDQLGFGTLLPETEELDELIPSSPNNNNQNISDTDLILDSQQDLTDLKDAEPASEDLSSLSSPKDTGREQYGVEADQAYLSKKVIINFENNSNDLSQENQAKLRELALLLKNNRNRKIKITGHSDSIGNESYNMKLSKFRANIVKSFMSGSGAEPDQLIVEGKGGYEPVANNATSQGRWLNRRVELEFIIP